ncbi:MAG: dipeptidase [bacterium]
MTIDDYLKTQRVKHLDDLQPFLKIASVSADPKFKQQVLDCADYLKGYCEKMGFDEVSVLNTEGFPVVFARLGEDTAKPTVLFYGHYDVQPADPLDLWHSSPFDPTIRDGYIYARGVADDKGQVFCHLLAIQALIEQKIELPVNIKILIEGEEEIGSPHLADLLEREQERLSADYIVISDTPMFSKEQPSLCTSLRGLVHSEIKIAALSGDLHSGQHGGAVHNPIDVLAHLLTQLKDKKGRIQIPGFYEDVLAISEAQKEALSSLDFCQDTYYQSLGAGKGFGEEGYNCLERRWYRPTLDCNGIWGGYTGEGSKTVLPAEASMKLSLRLVANQDPQRIKEALDRFVIACCPPHVSLSIQTEADGHAYHCNLDSKAMSAASVAIEKSFGKRPLLTGEGGSIPIVPMMATLLQADVVLMGFNLPDDAIHAPNERFLLDHFYKGINAAVVFYKDFGQ